MRFFLLVLFLFLATSKTTADETQQLFNDLKAISATGDPEAQYYLGMMYNNGLGTPQNFELANSLFQLSAKQGHPLSAYKIGCYHSGQGNRILEQDINKALKWKRIAADQGYSLAQFDVGNIIAEHGLTGSAIKYWEKAAAQGFVRAFQNLAVAYENGLYGADVDLAKAHAYWRIYMKQTFGYLPKEGTIYLEKLAADMFPEQISQANEIVIGFQPFLSDLTQEARQGLSKAKEFVVHKLK